MNSPLFKALEYFNSPYYSSLHFILASIQERNYTQGRAQKGYKGGFFLVSKYIFMTSLSIV